MPAIPPPVPTDVPITTWELGQYYEQQRREYNEEYTIDDGRERCPIDGMPYSTCTGDTI